MNNLMFSINSWIFGKITFEEIAKRAKRIGVDGLEIDGEPDNNDIDYIKKILDKYELIPVSVCGTFSDEKRAFNHISPEYRKNAIEYGKSLIDMASKLNADRVLLVPSQLNNIDYYVSKEVDWNNATESLREVAKYAQSKGNITIMLECVNKYEVNLVRSIDDGIRMIKDTKCNNIKLVGDTFHMQMEEASGIHNAIRFAGSNWLAHLHVSDNTREVPGKGCINWREIFIALNDIQFLGAISFEPLPNRLTPYEITNGVLNPDDLEKDLKYSLNFFKTIMKSII